MFIVFRLGFVFRFLAICLFIGIVTSAILAHNWALLVVSGWILALLLAFGPTVQSRNRDIRQ